MIYGPSRTFALTGMTNGEYAVETDGTNVLFAWMNGTTLSVIKSTNQGYDVATGSPVTVNTNAANKDVMLNESFRRDPVTGRWHLFFGRNTFTAGQNAQLLTTHSDDTGATWSTPVVVDDGTAHAQNRFYRVGLAVYNGVVTIHYASIDNGAYTTDGLWSSTSTDGGATWTAPAKRYAGTVALAGEPNAYVDESGTAHLSWYDSGVNANAGGNLFYARGVWSASGWTWAAAATQVTTGQTCGRSRVCASNGVVMLIANSNWGGNTADVLTVRSADNGTTWAAPVTQDTHSGTTPLDHPWIQGDSDLWRIVYDVMTTPLTYRTRVSTDGGATWSSGPVPMTQTGTSDAPRIVSTNDLSWVVGFDGATAKIVMAALAIFSPDPSLTATTVVDSFNRANETPLSGGGTWSKDIVASAGLKLASNVVTRNSGSGSFDRAGSYRNDRYVANAGAYAEHFGTVGGTVSTDGVCEWSATDETGNNGYVLEIDGGTSPIAELWKVTGGTRAGPLSSTTSVGLTVGDKWLYRQTAVGCVGYRYVSASSDWQEVVRATDTTYQTSLRPALNIVGVSGVPTLDDWGYTQLASPSNSVAPVASGSVGGTLSVTKGTWATANGATPTRYSYQWQSSPAGANTWTSISRATLPTYDSSADNTKDYRCVVTGKTSLGTATANSNTLSAPAASTAHVFFRARPKGGATRLRA